MEAELAAEIKRLGLAQAYFQFTVAVEQAPLDPRGWLGLALVAEASGDSRQGAAYRQRVAMLGGNATQTAQDAQEPLESAEGEAEYLDKVRSDPNVAQEGVYVFTAPSVSQEYGFVPVKVEDHKDYVPLLRLGCPILAVCSCCCWIGVIRPGCQGSQVPTAPPSQPANTATIPNPIQPIPPTQPTQPHSASNEWDTVKLWQLGEVYIMIPPGIEKTYAFERHPERDHIEFKALGGAQPYIQIDISTPNHDYDPWANATKLDRSFAKNYGAKYRKARLDQTHGWVIWQFDVQKKDQLWRKSDCFKRLKGGRAAAIILEADPTTFERFRPDLVQIYGTLVEGHKPDPVEGSL